MKTVNFRYNKVLTLIPVSPVLSYYIAKAVGVTKLCNYYSYGRWSAQSGVILLG